MPTPTTPLRLPMIEEVAVTARSAVVLGHGGGSDCFLANLVAGWLRSLGVERVLLGGVACQWWPVDGMCGELVRVVGPEFYDPLELTDAEPLGEHAVLVGPDARLGERRPHEATLARHLGARTFVVSHRGGGRGSAAGLAAVVAHAGADLVISVDVGSDTLSTGDETRPVQTALADHLTTAALLAQDVPTYFALAGYGADGEMELEELDANFARVLAAGGLRGAVVPSPAAIDELASLHEGLQDPVGSLVAHAARGEFGLYRVRKETPWGVVARLGPAAVPVWVMDPEIVVDSVATHVRELVATTSVDEAEEVYWRLGRIPETRVARCLDFGR
jgi:hypothetical protein